MYKQRKQLKIRFSDFQDILAVSIIWNPEGVIKMFLTEHRNAGLAQMMALHK